MAKSRKMWVFSPPKRAKLKLPNVIKATVSAEANELIESVLKPTHVKPPTGDERFNLNGMAIIFTSAPSMPALAQMPSHHTLRPNLLVWNMLALSALVLHT